MRPAWFPSWEGERAVVLASGPSAVEQPIDLARGRARVIAVNNSWRLAPWADALYASDRLWWEHYRPDFAGLRISRSPVEGCHLVKLKRRHCGRWYDKISLPTDADYRLGTIGAGGNSGFQALGLAIQFGARDIALVGFDMTVDKGSHWHGDHQGLGNPKAELVRSWRSALDSAAAPMAAAGITVTVCGDSALRNYPKMGLEEWLGSESTTRLNTAPATA